MSILKKIVTPFAAAGRWIKETAWVQPLLIVGVIFGVIFCIPSITTAIQNATQSTDIDWYEVQWLKLDGSANKESTTNLFFKAYNDAQTSWESGNKDAAKESLKNFGGEKFFLFFVQSDCSGCEETQSACEYLLDNWDSKISDLKNEKDFSYRSIICDQEIDDALYKKVKPFDHLFADKYFLSFCEDAQTAGRTSNYYRYGNASSTIDSNLENLLGGSTGPNISSNFQTPMVVFFDLTDKNTSDYIMSTILYSFPGSDDQTRADSIANCWQSFKEFSADGKTTA